MSINCHNVPNPLAGLLKCPKEDGTLLVLRKDYCDAVMEHLSPDDLHNCSGVCKVWEERYVPEREPLTFLVGCDSLTVLVRPGRTREGDLRRALASNIIDPRTGSFNSVHPNRIRLINTKYEAGEQREEGEQLIVSESPDRVLNNESLRKYQTDLYRIDLVEPIPDARELLRNENVDGKLYCSTEGTYVCANGEWRLLKKIDDDPSRACTPEGLLILRTRHPASVVTSTSPTHSDELRLPVYKRSDNPSEPSEITLRIQPETTTVADVEALVKNFGLDMLYKKEFGNSFDWPADRVLKAEDLHILQERVELRRPASIMYENIELSRQNAQAKGQIPVYPERTTIGDVKRLFEEKFKISFEDYALLQQGKEGKQNNRVLKPQDVDKGITVHFVIAKKRSK